MPKRTKRGLKTEPQNQNRQPKWFQGVDKLVYGFLTGALSIPDDLIQLTLNYLCPRSQICLLLGAFCSKTCDLLVLEVGSGKASGEGRAWKEKKWSNLCSLSPRSVKSLASAGECLIAFAEDAQCTFVFPSLEETHYRLGNMSGGLFHQTAPSSKMLKVMWDGGTEGDEGEERGKRMQLIDVWDIPHVANQAIDPHLFVISGATVTDSVSVPRDVHPEPHPKAQTQRQTNPNLRPVELRVRCMKEFPGRQQYPLHEAAIYPGTPRSHGGKAGIYEAGTSCNFEELLFVGGYDEEGNKMGPAMAWRERPFHLDSRDLPYLTQAKALQVSGKWFVLGGYTEGGEVNCYMYQLSQNCCRWEIFTRLPNLDDDISTRSMKDAFVGGLVRFAMRIDESRIFVAFQSDQCYIFSIPDVEWQRLPQIRQRFCWARMAAVTHVSWL